MFWSLKMLMNCHSFETSPARRVDPGLEPGWVKEKIRKEKTRLIWAKLDQKFNYNLFIFVFFTKTMSF
jgi:hypothetical protein